MSSPPHSLVTLSDYLQLPERPETGKRYELHDGEVVLVPAARPLHIKLQKRIERLLEALAGELGVVTIEFPYRPVINLQYWFADVAYVLRADWDAMPPDDYPVYAPAIVVELLSPSNTPAKIGRQRIGRDVGGHAGVLGGGSGTTDSASDQSQRHECLRPRRRHTASDVRGRSRR